MRSLSPLLLPLLVAAPALAVNPAWPNPNATRAELALPQNWPDDPNYGYVVKEVCPSGPLAGQTVLRPQRGQWNLWGFYPPDTEDPCGDPSVIGWQLGRTLLPEERQAMSGTGLSADVAWTMTTGDPRVLIAVHDSGAIWSQPDLVNKWFLNQGELPKPIRADGTECPAYDCNGDGVFNVLDYTSGSGHDQPTFDKVTDPRILAFQCAKNPECRGDVNGNGLLDPEDLIAVFSNGKDDDGNGFVDDICGWDFYEGDNDPADDVFYGHGTGEALDSAAEANNGIDNAGVCPDCRVMPIRVGDSFMADADHFGEGVLYSLSMGAQVIQEALGSLDATPLMQRAIDAAYARGTIVIASAADEDSQHHNWPANAEHTMVVHAVRYDSPDAQTATSFIRYNDCTNGGGHLGLSTPGVYCSSEATGKSSGHAGLIYSAWLKYHPNDPPLTSPEVMQILWTSVEDIDVPGSAQNPSLYPSGPGWDWPFGYGRNDAGASVQAVKDGRIPPEVDVTSPGWFETIDPGQRPTVAIAGHVSAARAISYDYTVQVAPGLQPAPADFQTVAQLSGIARPTDGPLASFDPSTLVANPSAVSTDPNAFAATVVVSAVAHYGAPVGDVPGVFRKSFFVHKDPDLFSGFPLYLGASGESSPHLVDLDGSGKDTIVLATTDGKVHAIRWDGSELPGWPVKVDPPTDVSANPAFVSFAPDGPVEGQGQAITATVAVGSLAGDGTLDVVASTVDGRVYAWNTSGALLPGFPVAADPSHYLDGTHDSTQPDGTKVTYELDKGFFASPALADLGKDGKLEIVQPGEDGWLYVWDGDGKPYPGFPLEIYDPAGEGGLIEHTRLMTTAAVGDIDGDGFPEIVIGSNERFGAVDCRAYAIHHDGSLHAGGPYLPGWPVNPKGLRNEFLPDVGEGVPNCAAMADLNGDGKLEVSIQGMAAQPQFFDGTGKLLGLADDAALGAQSACSPQNDLPYEVAISYGSFGDVDGDGKVDFVDGTVGLLYAASGLSGANRATPGHEVAAWSVEKDLGDQGIGFVSASLPGFPAPAADFQFFMNYTIADIDGDGKNEVVSGTGVYLVTAYRADGSQPAGWPKNTGGWLLATPAVGDIDGDGLIDVVVPSREGWLWAWHGHGRADRKIEWEGFHHDAQNSGNYAQPLEVRHGPSVSTPPATGCHCSAGGGEGLLALLGLAALRRRRR